jgi:hypothetical protein
MLSKDPSNIIDRGTYTESPKLSEGGLPTGIERTEGVGNISATKTAKGANAG